MKNRNTINMLMFVLTAAPTVKLINKTLQVWYNGRRPYISDIGAITGIKLESRALTRLAIPTKWSKFKSKNING